MERPIPQTLVSELIAPTEQEAAALAPLKAAMLSANTDARLLHERRMVLRRLRDDPNGRIRAAVNAELTTVETRQAEAQATAHAAEVEHNRMVRALLRARAAEGCDGCP